VTQDTAYNEEEKRRERREYSGMKQVDKTREMK